EQTSTNPIATLFAWTGALKKRGEIDKNAELMDFAEKLEKASIATIENGVMTGDLYSLSTIENKKKVNTQEFFVAIKSTLEKML
ncbi:MAG: isocitrate/isopropylmalate family dehydrogenase, partial [Oscillospiraceae bacterium]